MDDARSYVLDLCDEAVGQKCVRGQRWPWLRDEAGEQVAVDGWWPDLEVALVLTDGSIGSRLMAILRTIDAHGIESLAFDMRTLTAEGAATAQRREDYLGMFRTILTDPGQRYMVPTPTRDVSCRRPHVHARARARARGRRR